MGSEAPRRCPGINYYCSFGLEQCNSSTSFPILSVLELPRAAPSKTMVVPEEELLQVTTPRTTALLRRRCSEGYKDPQFDALNNNVVGLLHHRP
eukprot:3275827-Amphidinium_carterae.1